jgi:hypothetical protein
VRATRIWACLARHFDHVLIIPAGVYEPGSDICWTFFLSANHSIPSFRTSRNKISCCAEVATLKSSWRAFILLSVDHHSCFLPPTPVSSSCLFHQAFHLFTTHQFIRSRSGLSACPVFALCILKLLPGSPAKCPMARPLQEDRVVSWMNTMRHYRLNGPVLKR